MGDKRQGAPPPVSASAADKLRRRDFLVAIGCSGGGRTSAIPSGSFPVFSPLSGLGAEEIGDPLAALLDFPWSITTALLGATVDDTMAS